MNKEEICKQVRKICENANLDFLFIVPGKSEWSIKNNKHIKQVADFHKATENDEE